MLLHSFFFPLFFKKKIYFPLLKQLKKTSFKKLEAFKKKKKGKTVFLLWKMERRALWSCFCFQAKNAKQLEADLNLDTAKKGREGRGERGSREGRQECPLAAAGHGSSL